MAFPCETWLYPYAVIDMTMQIKYCPAQQCGPSLRWATLFRGSTSVLTAYV